MSSQQDLTPGHGFELLDCSAQRLAVGLIKEQSGLPFHHRFHCAATAVSNHWTARGISLERSHAEIFFTREQQRAAARGVIIDYSIRLPSQKLNAIISQLFQARAIRTIADDDQALIHPLASFDRQI